MEHEIYCSHYPGEPDKTANSLKEQLLYALLVRKNLPLEDVTAEIKSIATELAQPIDLTTRAADGDSAIIQALKAGYRDSANKPSSKTFEDLEAVRPA